MTNEAQQSPLVLSAMSGGVDSSVATLLLMQEGFDVMGVTMKLFDDDILAEGSESGCCSLDDVEDAREVCRRLGIQHVTLNFKDRFAECVIDRFCDTYLSGGTPNPCIDCNRYLKFEGLQRRRRELGAEYVATGHYVQRKLNEESGAWELWKAVDASKDQSYVLYHLTQDDLTHMLFPLGALRKGEVRALAKEHGFGNAEKSESQDICFVPDGDYVDFIRRYVGVGAASNMEEPGDIVDADGNLLGRHQGLVHYTIGQRKGIGVASSEPLYVVDKKLEAGELVVAHHDGLMVDEVHVRDLNVISGDFTPRELVVEAKTSYRQKPTSARLEILEGRTARIRFDEPVVRPAPGQSAVCYEGDKLICGGTVV